MPNLIKLHVAFVGGKPKGVFTDRGLEKVNKPYWDELKQTREIDEQDWIDQKVRLDNIMEFM